MSRACKLETVIIWDHDDQRRTAVYRALRSIANPLPVESLRDLGKSLPRDAWFLVNQDTVSLHKAFSELAQFEEFYPVIVYGENASVQDAISAIRMGAISFIARPCDSVDLEQAISCAEPLVEERSTQMLAQIDARARIRNLTRREREVLSLVCAGLSNREVGEKLGISPRTVEIFRSNAFAKLEVRNSIEAVRAWLQAEPSDLDRKVA